MKKEKPKIYIASCSFGKDSIAQILLALENKIRLKRLEGTNKVSLLEKYGYTEAMAMDKCKEHNLISPCYSMSLKRGGVLVLCQCQTKLIYPH